MVNIGIVPPIFTPGIKAVASCYKIGSLCYLFMIETTVCTFDINNLFDNSAKIFDLDEAPIKKKKHIKVLFRGVSKDNSHKVIVVFKIAEGVICKHNLEKFDNINKWYRYEYCCSKYLA